MLRFCWNTIQFMQAIILVFHDPIHVGKDTFVDIFLIELCHNLNIQNLNITTMRFSTSVLSLFTVSSVAAADISNHLRQAAVPEEKHLGFCGDTSMTQDEFIKKGLEMANVSWKCYWIIGNDLRRFAILVLITNFDHTTGTWLSRFVLHIRCGLRRRQHLYPRRSRARRSWFLYSYLLFGLHE